MSRAGEEMILELANLLGTDVVKTAAKEDDDKEKKEKAKEKKEKANEKEEKEKAEKKEKDDKKKEKEEKKASVMMNVINDLVKLAEELDEVGAEEASSLVDDALRVIVQNLEKKKIAQAEEDDVTEAFEEEESVTGREEGMGARQEPALEAFGPGTPEGLSPSDVQGGTIGGGGQSFMDNMDRLLSDPEVKAFLAEKLRGMV